MDTSFCKVALTSQSVIGAAQFIIVFFFLGGVLGALQFYHANDRLTFSCSLNPDKPDKPNMRYDTQHCHDEYTSTMSPGLTPLHVVAITYGVLCVCWIVFWLYSARTIREIKRAPPNQRETQWGKLHGKYIIHVVIRLVLLVGMIGGFCGSQTLVLPSKFECSPHTSQTNKTVISVNQKESKMRCNDLHHKEKSILNIITLVIVGSVMALGIYELISQLRLTGNEFPKTLLGNISEEGNNNFENLLSGENNASGDTEDTGNNLPAVSSYTTALKESIRSQTEYLPKWMVCSPNVRTDEIFSNVLIQLDRKTLKKKAMGLTRSDQLRCFGQVSAPPVEHCEEIFIAAANDKHRPERILVTGKAGIGKTLLCQKLLRDWADDKLFQSQASKIPNFKFAYLLTFRQLNGLENRQLSLQELLNLSTVLDDSSNIDDSLFEYIVNHSEEVFIIIDGYDEYSQQHCIAGTSDQQYPNGAKDRMPVAVLCTKLIKRRLLRKSVVMITSRPDESDKMGGIPFDRYLEIAGFSPQHVEEFIENYFRGNETMRNTVLDHVTKNENLVSFAHIPFMCFLLCFYMEHALETSNSTNDLPVSTTEIYSEIVNIFELKHDAASEYRTKQIPERLNASHQVESTLDELSKFAAELLFQKKPVFEERDMEERFLPEEIEKLKGSGLLHCGPPFMMSISETAKYYNFTHLTIQEYLAARWFEREIRDVIPTDVSDMVMQFMAGILSKNKSGELLMEKLLEGISSSSSSDHLLLRAKCLSEYQDKEFAKNVIKNHPHHYSQNGELFFGHLNGVDCFAISFLLDVFSALNEEEATTAQHQGPEQSFSVNSLTINNSSLTLSGIKRICESLERECCLVTKLSFDSVPLTDECVDCISRLVFSKLTELCIMNSSITNTGVSSLCDALKDPSCKVIRLNLTRNQLTDTDVSSLCHTLKDPSCKVTTLNLTRNQITDTGVTSLCDALKDPSCKVATLNLTLNQITDTGVTSLCNLLRCSSCKVTTLGLTTSPSGRTHNQCSDISFGGLCDALKDPSCKVTTLDLRYSKFSVTSVVCLCDTLKQSSCKLTKLDLTQCEITDSGVSSLCNAIQHPSCKVTILNLSGNQITDTGITSLCEAVQRDNCKLVALDLGGNRGISEGSKQSLRYVAEQHRPDFHLLM